MLGRIASYFDFEYHKTNFKTEFVAGLSTFLALSYIFVVNPAILSQGGMNKSIVLFATVITSFAATFLMGLWARKPFVLAPGLELNSYVVFFVIGTLGFTWQESLGACFWSAILFLIMTLTNIRIKIINAIPNGLKTGLSAAVGIFLIIIALKLADILVYKGIELRNIGSFVSSKAVLFYISLILVLLFTKVKFKGSILVSIIVSSFIAFYFEIRNAPSETFILDREMFRGVLKSDLMIILNPKILSAIIILFLIDFYGSIAKIIGLTYNTTIVEKDGNITKMKEALTIDGLGSVLGATLGTTCVTIFVESGVGIGVGGRTGFTAIICSLFMLMFLPLSSLLNYVPVEATTGALFWVGVKLMPKKQNLLHTSWVEIGSILVMLIIVAFTFSLDKAMLFGFLFYIIGETASGKIKEVNIYLIISTILLVLGLILSL